MKKRLVPFMIFIVAFLTFGCSEEVVPQQAVVDEVNQEAPRDIKATDGEEEPEQKTTKID